MAQVSIQYALEDTIDVHDEKKIKKELDTLHGVSSVSVNVENGILCVDFDDTGVDEQQVERILNVNGYRHTMLDKIIF